MDIAGVVRSPQLQWLRRSLLNQRRTGALRLTYQESTALMGGVAEHIELNRLRRTTMAGHRGTQLASYILTRSTIQTAVVLATGMGLARTAGEKRTKKAANGRNRINAQTVRKWGCELMLGALQPGLLDYNIVAMDLDSDREKNRQINAFIRTRQLEAEKNQVLKAILSPNGDDHFKHEWKVDLVLTPIDGAKALRDGRSGSVSVAAAGSTGCFHQPENAPPDDEYFVIAIGKEILTDKVIRAIEKYDSFTTREMSLDDFLAEFKLIDDVLSAVKEISVPPLLGLTLEGPYLDWNPSVIPWHRKRRLDGSVVAAAIGVYTKKIPCAMFASRLPQVIQASIAAVGLRGRLYAIPLKSTKTVRSGRVLRERDFVKGKNAVLCCTSVTEVCVMDRVRFGFDRTAKTESITVSLATGKVTTQSDELDLRRANMRRPNGKEVIALKLMQEFRADFEDGHKEQRGG